MRRRLARRLERRGVCARIVDAPRSACRLPMHRGHRRRRLFFARWRSRKVRCVRIARVLRPGGQCCSSNSACELAVPRGVAGQTRRTVASASDQRVARSHDEWWTMAVACRRHRLVYSTVKPQLRISPGSGGLHTQPPKSPGPTRSVLPHREETQSSPARVREQQLPTRVAERAPIITQRTFGSPTVQRNKRRDDGLSDCYGYLRRQALSRGTSASRRIRAGRPGPPPPAALSDARVAASSQALAAVRASSVHYAVAPRFLGVRPTVYRQNADPATRLPECRCPPVQTVPAHQRQTLDGHSVGATEHDSVRARRTLPLLHAAREIMIVDSGPMNLAATPRDRRRRRESSLLELSRACVCVVWRDNTKGRIVCASLEAAIIERWPLFGHLTTVRVVRPPRRPAVR